MYVLPSGIRVLGCQLLFFFQHFHGVYCLLACILSEETSADIPIFLHQYVMCLFSLGYFEEFLILLLVFRDLILMYFVVVFFFFILDIH